jgi:hypothetical protein
MNYLKQTQTNPILPNLMVGKIALSEAEGPDLFYQFSDLFEFGVVSSFEYFKKGHFSAVDSYSHCLHFRYGDFLIVERSGRDGVGDNINSQAHFLQINGGLVNADVGFYACEQDLPTVYRVQFADELVVAAATETGLIDWLDVCQQFRNLRDSRAEGRGDLLAPEDGDIENFGGLDKDSDVFKEGFAVIH